jgi:hypothetical protein
MSAVFVVVIGRLTSCSGITGHARKVQTAPKALHLAQIPQRRQSLRDFSLARSPIAVAVERRRYAGDVPRQIAVVVRKHPEAHYPSCRGLPQEGAPPTLITPGAPSSLDPLLFRGVSPSPRLGDGRRAELAGVVPIAAVHEPHPLGEAKGAVRAGRDGVVALAADQRVGLPPGGALLRCHADRVAGIASHSPSPGWTRE